MLPSTCRELRDIMSTTTPKTILRLAAAAKYIFFRPSPYFLVAATAKELGKWARASATNECELVIKIRGGLDDLLGLCLRHCGLTMKRI